MLIEKVKAYLAGYGLDDRIREFPVSSATVALAAAAIDVEEARIAKSITLYDKDGGCILVVCAGDYKIDNAGFKAKFGFKPRMMSHEEALAFTGHAAGGICPFALPEGVKVYLDNSLRRFQTVFPAAGTSNSAVEVNCDELFLASGALGRENLCKPSVPASV